MIYDFNLLCYIRFLSGLIAICIGLFILRRKFPQGAVFLALFELAAAIWAIADGFEAAATTVPLKLLWAQIAYLGTTTSAVFFLLFSIHYTQQIQFANKKTLAFLMLVPVITIILAFSNSQHNLLWKEIIIIESTNQSVYYYGFWFWIYIFYEYSVLVAGFSILLFYAFKIFQLYRTSIWLLLLGTLLPFCASILYVFKLSSFIEIDLTPISFIFSGIIVLISQFQLKMFNIIPIAQKQVTDNLHLGMLVIDSSGRIIDSNPEFNKLSQLSSKDMIGCKIDKILSKLHININDFTEQNEFTMERQIIVDGEQKIFEVKHQKVLDNIQSPIGNILIFNDITIKKLILDAIAESNQKRKIELLEKESLIKDLNAFARTVAHDLKNQINLIVGYSEVIKLKLLENDENKAIEMLEIVKNQSLKMNNIIDELLKLSTIRKEDIMQIPIDTCKIIDDVLKRLEKQITLSKSVISKPDQWPVVMGYPQWIEEVWFNLISNAIKYGGNPPEIKLGYDKASPASYNFWVSDNGNGLSENSFEIIFEDFERLGRIDIEGYGLGLPIVKRIIEKIGGQVNVSSANQPGKGCVFSFTLFTDNIIQN